jgi:hypothetical protein
VIYPPIYRFASPGTLSSAITYDWDMDKEASGNRQVDVDIEWASKAPDVVGLSLYI